MMRRVLYATRRIKEAQKERFECIFPLALEDLTDNGKVSPVVLAMVFFCVVGL